VAYLNNCVYLLGGEEEEEEEEEGPACSVFLSLWDS